MADKRDDKLRALLPSRDCPYSVETLDEAELRAFDEAPGDAFGGPSGQELRLPREINSGLLKHSFFLREFSDCEEVEAEAEAFWQNSDDEQPAPSELFPLGFHERRLRIYFSNQLDRFYHQSKRELPGLSEDDRFIENWLRQRLVLGMIYKKPWYEFHAVQLLDWIEKMKADALKPNYAKLMGLMVSSFSGQLGRLVEQYFWRFRFEGAAMTGLAGRDAASAGGKAKARLHRDQHASWQKAAEEIWKRRPKLSKTAVAEIIMKAHGASHTPKHVARFISRS